MLARVVVGLGVISCESLYLLQKLTFVVFIFCISVISQLSPLVGKEVFICVTEEGSKLVILQTLDCRELKPAHFQSPFIAVSRARKMLQSVISKFCLSQGKQEKDIIVIISVPLAEMSSSIIITRIYLDEQGLLSGSLRNESQGGQLLSNRQQRTVTIQKAKKIAAKMMQGEIILEIQMLSAFISPFTTISSTWSLSL